MDFDTFLKVWGVLGTVIGAVAGTWWQRKVQIEDREHSILLDETRESRSDRREREKSNRIAQEKRYQELKDAYANVLTHAATVSIRMRMGDKKGMVSAFDEFNAAIQFVCLLADESVKNAAENLSNACIAFGRTEKLTTDDEKEKVKRRYQDARSDFVNVTRDQLKIMYQSSLHE